MKRKTLSILIESLRDLTKQVKTTLERLNNMPEPDELGALQALAEPINARIQSLKEEIVRKYGNEALVTGELFDVRAYVQPFTYIEADKARRLLDPETLKSIQTDSERQMVKAQPRAARPF